MDHSTHIRLSPAELTEDMLSGTSIYGPGDETVGKVSHLHGSGPTASAVVDVGGFLGMGARPVALPLNLLDFMRDDDGTVHATTALTKEEAKELPEHHH